MRIAVVQLAVEPAQRALTLQRALAAIDAAAEHDPEPDLILLPAFCDVPALVTTDKAIPERLEGPTIAACGQRARQWGVFVAAGFAERSGPLPFVTGVLLDPDADVRIAQRQRHFGRGLPAYFTPGEGCVAATTELGRVAVLVGDDLLDDATWAAAAQAGVGLVLGVAWWADRIAAPAIDAASVRRQLAERAARHGLYGAVADCAMAGGDADWIFPGISTIVTSTGQVVGAAAPGEPATLWGDLDIPPPPPAEEGSR